MGGEWYELQILHMNAQLFLSMGLDWTPFWGSSVMQGLVWVRLVLCALHRRLSLNSTCVFGICTNWMCPDVPWDHFVRLVCNSLMIFWFILFKETVPAVSKSEFLKSDIAFIWLGGVFAAVHHTAKLKYRTDEAIVFKGHQAITDNGRKWWDWSLLGYWFDWSHPTLALLEQHVAINFYMLEK